MSGPILNLAGIMSSNHFLTIWYETLFILTRPQYFCSKNKLNTLEIYLWQWKHKP